MARGSLVAGVDCSTQATKVLVVDPDSGEVVATGRSPHTVSGTGGARETDPREWWGAVKAALSETHRASEITAIAVGGQQHGLVTLDAAGRPLRPAMLWNDTRASVDAARLTETLEPEAWAARTGLRPVASFTVDGAAARVPRHCGGGGRETGAGRGQRAADPRRPRPAAGGPQRPRPGSRPRARAVPPPGRAPELHPRGPSSRPMAPHRPRRRGTR